MALKAATEYRLVGGAWVPSALTPSAVRRQRVQPSDVDDPSKVADQLTKLQDNQTEVNRALAASPLLGPKIFHDVACGTSGATALQVAHGYGRPARWYVVRWARTTPGGSHGLEGLTNDDKTLVLRSYVAGVATVMVL